MTSLTDTEYEEIFSLAIKRGMAGDIPSPVMEHDTGKSDTEDEIEVKVPYLSQSNKNIINLN
jgi:hypothetical protein